MKNLLSVQKSWIQGVKYLTQSQKVDMCDNREFYYHTFFYFVKNGQIGDTIYWNRMDGVQKSNLMKHSS